MHNRIIYLDNAATTRVKPENVYEAFNCYTREIGVSPGRGSHFLAIEASRYLFQARKVIAEYFGCPKTNHVVFTKNATEAANLFLNGFLKENDHVLISSFEHNAIFRPIHKLKEMGRITYDIIPIIPSKGLNIEAIQRHIKENTKLCIVSLGSNLTGEILFSKEIIDCLHKKNIQILLDTSQGAGRHRIHMEKEKIDFIIFTGHKDLYGLPGTGGLCSLQPLEINPLIQGGTGVHAETFVNPEIYPEKLEAGTLNMPAIWSLKSGIEYITANQLEMKKKEQLLYNNCIKELKKFSKVIIYGGTNDKIQLPIICFNIEGMSCQLVSQKLSEYKICVRAGLHCSILGHTSLGTECTGTVRVSLDWYNTIEEIDKFIDIIKNICKE